MNAYCPECETDLDDNTGICPACRWDPRAATDVRTFSATKPPEMSLTERYRGTAYDFVLQSGAASHQAGIQLFNTYIVSSVRFTESPGAKIPLILSDPEHDGSKAYKALVQQIIHG